LQFWSLSPSSVASCRLLLVIREVDATNNCAAGSKFCVSEETTDDGDKLCNCSLEEEGYGARFSGYSSERTLLEDITAITKGVESLKIPTRKFRDKCGTKGRRITVETNHVSLDLSRIKNDIVIHYDVNLELELPKRLARLAMEMFRRKHYQDRYPAFDGKKNLYSSGPLPFGGEISDDVEVYDVERNSNRVFKITIKFASRVDLRSLITYMRKGTSLSAPQEAIQAIDIVLHNAQAFRYVQVGRSFFSPPQDAIIQLGDGMEMWYGFFQSAILGWKPLLNIDVVHKAFPSPKSVIEILCEILHLDIQDLQRELTEWEKHDFANYIKGLKVEYMLPNIPSSKRAYRVNTIVESASRQQFDMKGKRISVDEYFMYEKKIHLSYPNLPCLHVGSPNRTNAIYIPAELCKITKGQVVNRKLNETQTSNMIKQTATSTTERKRKILESLKSVRLNDDCVVKEFGLSVCDKFEKVEARILDAPRLEYNMNTRRGVWRVKSFIATNNLTNWIMLNLTDNTRLDEIRRFASDMQRMGQQLGMYIKRPMKVDRRDSRDLGNYFRSVKDYIQLIVVIVPDDGNLYAKVKREAEVQVGVLTQCIKGRTVQRMNPATCSNILLKINSKLNLFIGWPRCLLRPIMIVGADVTHPSPDQNNIPSVAAVCASHDPLVFKYNIQIRLQPPKVEIIEDLQSIIREQLLFFYRNTSYKPERIIFFRDGVGEGQFAQKSLFIYRTRLSTQSHISGHTETPPCKIFPIRDEDADGRNRNVPPGTIVDRQITHPTEMDFYLVSHASIQGVSRPTKYRLLWNDDHEMTEDEIEELSYYLCHMFSRCTRSVSYPAPTYNAHLAAYRARAYFEGLFPWTLHLQ
ncbi:hypothetical protein L9F63_003271, partial [Diploptera punctata]